MGVSRADVFATSGRWLVSALAVCIAVLVLLLAPKMASAAVTDCKGLAVDGQADCVLPTYAPTQYTVCDIAGSFPARANAWSACSAELGIPNPILSEEVAVAFANCFDKKLVPTGGVVGAVPWLSAGTYYNDNLCTSGTVRVVNGHNVWSVGNKSGASSNFAFTRRENVSCPVNYTAVSKTIRGISEIVACKPPIATCNPDQKWWGAPRSACLTKVVTVAASKPPQTCKTTVNPASTYQPKSDLVRNIKSPGVGDPIFPLTGAMGEVVVTGFNLDGAGLVLNYDTSGILTGFQGQALPSFGRLWTSSLHKNLVIGTGATTVTAYRGDRSVVTFALKGGVYVPDIDISDRVVASGGRYFYSDALRGVLETYDANGQLNLLEGTDGTVLSFSYSTGATATTPVAGYLTQVSDKTGRFLKFEYLLPAGALDMNAATSGLISKVTNSANQSIVVTYDTGLNLVALQWPDSKALQFQYANSALPWAMTGRLDENGGVHAAWTYDDRGRALGASLASGVDAYTLTYGAPPLYVQSAETPDPTLNFFYQRYEIQPPTGVSIATPNGESIAWSSQSFLGAPVLTNASQPAGSGCGASSSSATFDAAGNLSSRDDFQGGRTCYAYDSSNREVTRVEGLATSVACSSVLPANSALPAGARKITTEWHPDWRLPTKVVVSGRTDTKIYQGQTDPFTSTVATCSTAPSMANGKPLPLMCKMIVQSTIDSTTQITSYAYDEAGNFLTAKDARGHDTAYQYSLADGGADPAYDRVNVLLHGDGVDGANVFSDNSSPAKMVSIGYGAPTMSALKKKFGPTSLYFPGNASLKVSGAGGTTFWSSDWTLEFSVLTAVSTQGRASVFGNRDNSGLGMGGGELGLYYSGGLLTTINLSLAESSQWAGFGVSTSTPGFTEARASVGNFDQIAIVKQGLTYTFFLNGRMLQSFTRTVATMTPPYADFYIGAANKNNFYPYYFNGYLDDFRITLGAPRYVKNYAPRSTAFPDTGFAPGVDPTPYNLERITNTAGHVTLFTQYDQTGRVRQMIDPKGVVTDITYTPRGWVSTVTTTAPGGAGRVTSYTYDGVGQLIGVTQPDGTTLSYSYDAAHRLVGVIDAKGNSMNYTLDNVGNRIAEEIKDPAGVLQRSISRSFDALNRVQQVIGAAR